MGLLGTPEALTQCPAWSGSRPRAPREEGGGFFFTLRVVGDRDVGVTLRETNIAMENPHFQ